MLGGGVSIHNLSLFAHKLKPGYSRISFPPRQLLSCGSNAEAIPISIFKEKRASSDTRSGASFDLHIPSTPKKPTVPVRNIRISVGFVG